MSTVTAERAASSSNPVENDSDVTPRPSRALSRRVKGKSSANKTVPTTSRMELMFARQERHKAKLASAIAAKKEAEERCVMQQETFLKLILECIMGEPEAEGVTTIIGAFAALDNMIARARAEAAKSADDAAKSTDDAKKARTELNKQNQKMSSLSKQLDAMKRREASENRMWDSMYVESDDE